jgi:U5 small nuclear ribonucleoprotein component
LAKTIDELGIRLSKTELKMNIRPLLRLVCSRFFGDFSGLVDVIAEMIPAAVKGNERIVNDAYSGPLSSDFCIELKK